MSGSCEVIAFIAGLAEGVCLVIIVFAIRYALRANRRKDEAVGLPANWIQQGFEPPLSGTCFDCSGRCRVTRYVEDTKQLVYGCNKCGKEWTSRAVRNDWLMRGSRDGAAYADPEEQRYTVSAQ